MKKLKLAPELTYYKTYGTDGLATTHVIGAYSSLPLWFGKLLLLSLAVVLENDSYDLLIGTQFLREYNGIINLKDGFVSLLNYSMPLIFEEPAKLPGKRLKTCVLEYPTGIFSLKFRMHGSNLKSPPPSCPAKEGVPLLAPKTYISPLGPKWVLIRKSRIVNIIDY